MLHAVAIASYLLPFLALRSTRVPAVSPVIVFLIFFNLHYGIHSLNQGWMRMTAAYPTYIHDMYAFGIILANLFISFGLLFSRILLPWAVSKHSFHSMHVAKEPPTGSIRRVAPFIILVFLYSFVLLLVDGPSLPRTTEIFRYLLGTSLFSYEEIRRQLFDETLVEVVTSYTRQSSTALLICLCGLRAITTKVGVNRVLYVAAALLLFVAGSLQLNKFPFVYVTGIIFISCYVFLSQFVVSRAISLLQFAVVTVIGLSMLFGLYLVQYRDGMAGGLVSLDDIVAVVFYRLSLTQADALRMWYSEFPTYTPFLGLANVGLLARLLGISYFDVTSFIPATYVGATETTFQAGFMGSGYASFGFVGVAAYGFLAGFIAMTTTSIARLIADNELRAAYFGVACMNMYFLSSRELSAALLSGGIVLTPLIVLAADRWLRRRQLLRGSVARSRHLVR